ncbi:unnamed protein product [[Candida] boidinii]|nr:unnamed protein product [[Candida] boidinii]
MNPLASKNSNLNEGNEATITEINIAHKGGFIQEINFVITILIILIDLSNKDNCENGIESKLISINSPFVSSITVSADSLKFLFNELEEELVLELLKEEPSDQ